MAKKIIDISLPDAATVAAEDKQFEEKMKELDLFSLQTKLLLAELHFRLHGDLA